jgi:hypothetical protein
MTRMMTSGLIAAAIGAAVTVGLSFVMTPPWDLSRILICVAVASFIGSAIGYQAGFNQGRAKAE